jgi:hypothetical protein
MRTIEKYCTTWRRISDERNEDFMKESNNILNIKFGTSEENEELISNIILKTNKSLKCVFMIDKFWKEMFPMFYPYKTENPTVKIRESKDVIARTNFELIRPYCIHLIWIKLWKYTQFNITCDDKHI